MDQPAYLCTVAAASIPPTDTVYSLIFDMQRSILGYSSASCFYLFEDGQDVTARLQKSRLQASPRNIIQSKHSCSPSEALSLWRTGEGNVPRHMGGGESLQGLIYNEGSALLFGTHAVQLLIS